jgi:hypothetical protein
MGEGFADFQAIVALLSPTLGLERSRELVRGALDDLKIPREDLSFDEATRVLDHLGQAAGVVGSVARFAKVRLTLRDANRLGSDTLGQDRPPDSSAPVSGAVNPSVLTALLAPTVGHERSAEVVLETIHRMGYPTDRLTLQQGLDVLEHLAHLEGLVGVAARFAKARLIMHAAKS